MARPRKNSQSITATSTNEQPVSAMAQPAPIAKPSKQSASAVTGWKFWLMSILAALLLLVANSAYWVSHNIFDTDTFTRITDQALSQESSRTAIAGAVVDRLLEQRPVLRNVLGDQAVKLISGLLDTSQAQAVMDRAISRFHIAVTSNDPQNIEIDLTRLKSVIERIVALADVEEANINPDEIPDTVVLLDASKIPNFYQYGVIFLWLAPLALIAGLALFAWPYLKAPRDAWSTPLKQGLVIVAVSFLGLMLGPLFKPPVLAQVTTPNARIVVENVYNAFLDTFNRQTYLLLLIGIIFCLASGLWWLNDNRHRFQRQASRSSAT